MCVVADQKEWAAIVGTKAVEIIDPARAKVVRRLHLDRIITSRMVRRWKKQEGLNSQAIAKSRWCVHGFKDPDTGKLLVFAPTPQTQSLMLFLQHNISLDMHLEVADVKNGFCQGDAMARPWGDIYVEPYEGLGLPAGSLILLKVPVYGLNDATMQWHTTVTTWLQLHEFTKCLSPRAMLLDAPQQGWHHQTGSSSRSG